MANEDENQVVCSCYQVDYNTLKKALPKAYDQLRPAIQNGEIPDDDNAAQVEYLIKKLGELTKAGTACTSCHRGRNPSLEDVILENP